MGPTLTAGSFSSGDIVCQFITGQIPMCPQVKFAFVDVRDVAKAHILAMESDQANGERFIVSAKEMWMDEIAHVLNSDGYKAPQKNMPNWLLKIMAWFKSDLVVLSKMVGKPRDCHTTKAKDILDWKPRPAEGSILETARQLKQYELI